MEKGGSGPITGIISTLSQHHKPWPIPLFTPSRLLCQLSGTRQHLQSIFTWTKPNVACGNSQTVLLSMSYLQLPENAVCCFYIFEADISIANGLEIMTLTPHRFFLFTAGAQVHDKILYCILAGQ